MKLVERTTRFGGNSALRISRLWIVMFMDGEKKLGVVSAKGAETKTGICDLIGLNIGRTLILYESPSARVSEPVRQTLLGV